MYEMSRKGGASKIIREKAIDSLEERIGEHEKKLQENPASPERNEWERDIEDHTREIARQQRRLEER